MLYLAVKAALAGVIIAVVSEVARRSPTLGVFIVVGVDFWHSVAVA
jgi:hypothetical protein